MGATSDRNRPSGSRSGGGDGGDRPARLPFGGKKRLYDVIKVRLPGSTRTVECDASDVYVEDGSQVVVRTRRGLVLARTVGTRHRKVLPVDALQPIVRAATPRDVARAEENVGLARAALFEAVAESRAMRLDMKFVSAELMLDRRRLVFYFSSENRVDFRQLVRRLSKQLQARIEMHQVGVRDGAGMLGGIGSCGRELCCSTFLDDFEPVAIRMVKDQGLTLNPKKVSGMCGRLMCCLVYEHSGYVRGRKRLPKRRALVRTRHGLGRVRNVDVVQETVEVKHEDGTEQIWPLIEVMLDPDEDAPDGPSAPLVFTIDGAVSADEAPSPDLDGTSGGSAPHLRRGDGGRHRSDGGGGRVRHDRRAGPGAAAGAERSERRGRGASDGTPRSDRRERPRDADGRTGARSEPARGNRDPRRPGGPAPRGPRHSSTEGAPPTHDDTLRTADAATPPGEGGAGDEQRRRRRRRRGGSGNRAEGAPRPEASEAQRPPPGERSEAPRAEGGPGSGDAQRRRRRRRRGGSGEAGGGGGGGDSE